MHKRYENSEISRIWSSENKLDLWQKTELAVISAKENLGLVPAGTFQKISIHLGANAIDIDWWLKRDKEVNHDLNAFLDERLRFLPIELQKYFHDGLTSYDTEEPAFAKMLWDSLEILKEKIGSMRDILVAMARRYRYTIMNGRTHGQEAELQSFGKRCLTWLQAFNLSTGNITGASESLEFSKLSGAIGNYRGIDAEVEREALRILRFAPFYGATQIMPRELYAPIAQSLCQLVFTLNKIALDIRLGARSGRPLWQEPFGKKQKGSSAMPHKKNTIATEQIEGMARMAEGFFQMIMKNIVTWEERAIEQSCVERVAWPDLFHVAIHSIKTMAKVLEGLQVYPDNMILEIIDSCGCYAAGEAKEFLRHHGAQFGLSTEDAYRIVQLAAFNAFKAAGWQKEAREKLCDSLAQADVMLIEAQCTIRQEPPSIQDIIVECPMQTSNQLATSKEDIEKWNEALAKIFIVPENYSTWNNLFRPSNLLKGEATLFKEILGDG